MSNQTQFTQLSELIRLTLVGEASAIKTILTRANEKTKGQLFEDLLCELYQGNGWLAVKTGARADGGADLLLYHPQNPSTPSFIVQVKNHDRPLSYDSTRSELTKFEEQAAQKYNCNQFKIVSLSGYVEKAKDLTRFNLSLDDWGTVCTLIKNFNKTSNKVPHIELYSHNQIAYDKILSLKSSNDRVAVIQATGTGKSYLIAKILNDNADANALLLAPSNYILEQFKTSFPWFKNVKYQTYYGLSSGLKKTKSIPNYQIIICDEFHRVGAEEWGKQINALLNHNKAAFKLGVTATPIRYLDDSRNMADEIFEGNIAEQLSLTEAIVRKILPSPKYVAALYTLDLEISELEEKIKSSVLSTKEAATVRKQLEEVRINWQNINGPSELIKKHFKSSMKKFIVFCQNKKELDEMEWLVNSWFQKTGFNLKRKTYRIISGDSENDKNLSDFKKASSPNTIHLLFSINMLNEGLHISDVDGVILLRLTESPIIFYQQIGRCIQTNPNQTPIIFDFVNNFRNIRAQDFLHDLQIAKNVENSLRKNYQLNPSDVQFSITDTTLEIREILAEIENRIGGWEIQFQLLKLFSEEHGHCRVPQKYTANPRLGHWVSNQRANKVNLSPKQIQQLNSLDFDWDPRLTDWELGFKSLVAFSNENGHCNVPPKEDKYSGLRNWIFSQRENKDNLPPAFIKRLESIGFDWDPINTQWEQNYTELTKFSKQNGHCLVPYDYPQNKSLGLWVQYQRNNKRRLTPERLELLKKINFDWNRRASMWDQRYEELQLFKKEHGSCDVPTNYPKNKKLALWVVVQRSQKDKLTNERFELLKKIGFNFDPFLAKWEVNFKDLEQYQKENGHCNVPIRYAPNKKLASWVSIQREKKDKLSADQIQRLNTLGFVWDPFEEMWNVQFKALLEFKAEEGHYNVPQGYSKNRKLGSWVSFQRNHRDKITPERMKKLKKIRFFKD